MKFTLDTVQGIMIHSAQAGEVVLRLPNENPANPYHKQSYSSSLVLGGSDQVEDWSVTQIAELNLTHLEIVWQRQPDIVLLGTGNRLVFPNTEILQSFGTRGIGVEVMDTAAACRTYNILLAEGRNVMALLIVDQD